MLCRIFLKSVPVAVLLFFISATLAFADGKAPPAVIDTVAAECPKGINPDDSITKKVIVESKTASDGGKSESWRYEFNKVDDKCFNIKRADFVYLVEPNQAIYEMQFDWFNKPLVFIDYDAYQAKRVFRGVLKGVGAYTYKDGRGIPRTIPRMKIVKTNISLTPLP